MKKIIIYNRLILDKQTQEDYLSSIRFYCSQTSYKIGCNASSIFQDTNNGDSFIIIEEWENDKELIKHLNSAGFRLLLMLIDSLPEAPVIKISEVSHDDGLSFIKKAVDHGSHVPVKHDVDNSE
jgi:quinol monooxygenase YgiN